MNTSFATHSHSARVDTRMHRASLVDLEAEACAPECACPRDENQGRGPDCPQHPRSRVFRDDRCPAPTMKRPKANRWLVALALVYLCLVAAVGCDQVVRYVKQPPVVRS